MPALVQVPARSVGFLERFIQDAGGCVVLDGGLATELEQRGADISDALWSAKCLLDNPDLIGQVHLDYLRSGAQIISSCSYQATFPGFAARGIGQAQAEELLQLSVRLACEARDQAWKEGLQRGLVAASIGCYGAFLANGAEYSGDYGDVTKQDLKDFHRKRLQVLTSAGPDLLAFETVPSQLEAEAIADLLSEEPGGLPAWISFSCKDGCHVASGDRLADCVAAVEKCERIEAVGVNCTAPRFIHDLVKEAAKVTSKAIIIYPNSGEAWDGVQKEWVLSSGVSDEDFVSIVPVWQEVGARIIGGCCRTTPHTIRAIRNALDCKTRGGFPHIKMGA